MIGSFCEGHINTGLRKDLQLALKGELSALSAHYNKKAPQAQQSRPLPMHSPAPNSSLFSLDDFHLGNLSDPPPAPVSLASPESGVGLIEGTARVHCRGFPITPER
ncbi:hypothetical protein PAXRUDRAFT_11733 [Paxillus rubicundulus Ve08.2h10]|uniref:Unplaced genomic scaffold scaffold_251, whole genome shotgun sequence n=1 Tax=Paxillus rubicundulus Ve08.2h10 TaxID=930991 RepID=A0A0D0DCN5_9AGAM|nr:hypothetical protein PAXRUDRAFT_11733 [Paxillus rubicundulus Ve08.2h10]